MSEQLFGYNGKIAFIDLTDKNIKVYDLNPQMARDYLGGSGLSAKLIYDMLNEEDYESIKNDPFSEKNPIIFATGPITGTIRPSSGRYCVSGISPLSKIWGEGTSGGYFCISLRNCGFDAIVLLGKAASPTYLYIHDEIIEFKDASNIWGNDIFKSQELIKTELDNDKVKVATIGVGGENLVKYAGIFNDEARCVGRGGFGALMGSKNLKALAVHGTRKINIADSSSGKEILKKAKKAAMSDFLKTAIPNVFRMYGTNSYLDIGTVMGDAPAYYFTETEFLAEKLTGKTLREEYTVLDYGCAGCTLRCGKETLIDFNGEEVRVKGPEYEGVAAFGPMVGVFNSRKVIIANHLCNVYGIDNISTGVCISFLIYLVENNLAVEQIKQYLKDIKVEDIKWGNADLVIKLIEKIAKKEDIGDLLSQGVRTMAEKLNVDPELAAHVKGLEIPMHDPRAFAGQALSYMTSSVGANHNHGDWYFIDAGVHSFPRIRAKSGDRYSIKGRERGVKALQDLRAIDDSAVNCIFMSPSLDDIIGYINAATGFGYNRKTLLLIGERLNNLKRIINCKLGITREDDKLPKHVMKVLKTGKTGGIKLDLEDNLKRYYKDRGWDWDTGYPTQEKLNELGLGS